jgi:hypothetical protein
MKSEVEKLSGNLKMWEDGQIERIPDNKIDQAEKDYEKYKMVYKKIKKISLNIVDSLCEGMEMKRDEVVKHISGFEFDNEQFALLQNKQI